MTEKTKPKIVNEPAGIKKERKFDQGAWTSKTELGKLVKQGKIKSISAVLDSGKRILESEIIDYLVPNLEVEILAVGQSKGKFGGGKKSVWKQTQKKSREGNKPKFATLTAIGNNDGYIGLGYGKSKETMPAREKSLRKAKLNIMEITRASSSGKEKTSFTIPAKVTGSYGSARLTLIPAPRGTGLIVEEECKKILKIAGIQDVYSKSRHVKTKYNLLNACFDALKQTSKLKLKEDYIKKANIVRGSVNE